MPTNEPERSKSHVQEESSRLYVKTAFNRFGWVAHDLNPDYGEDLFVFVYEDRIATGDLFFVQIKSTEADVSTGLAYRLRVATIRRWTRLSVPVVLVLYTSVPNVRSYWSVFSSKEWSDLLLSIEEGQETVSIPQDPKKILDEMSAVGLRSAVTVPLRAVDLAPLRGLLRHAEKHCEEIGAWLLKYKHEYDEFHQATTEAETKAMVEHGGWGSKGHSIHETLSPHHHMGSAEWSAMTQVLFKRLDTLPKTVPKGILSDAEAFSTLILGLQRRILARNENQTAMETVHQLAQLELSGSELTTSLTALQNTDPSMSDVLELLIKRALVSACIDQIKWSAIDLLIA
jgi:hypothetical protein